jgi:hypothetical protein
MRYCALPRARIACPKIGALGQFRAKYSRIDVC